MKKILLPSKKYLLVTITLLLLVIWILVLTAPFQMSLRDSKRKTDINEIAQGLEVNYGNTQCPGVSVELPYCALDSGSRIMFYNGKPAENPKPGGAPYFFNSIDKSPGSTFIICALLETQTGNSNQYDTLDVNTENKGKYYCKKSEK